jgi:hypothetical protein
MSVVADKLSDFMAFTYLFRHCRPKHEDFYVYEVDAGEPTDYNLVLKAMKVEGEAFSGDSEELVIAKEWVLENLEEILANVPDPETTRA